MILKTFFYSALVLFCAGCVFKLHTWFSRNVGMGAEGIGYGTRLFSTAAAALRALSSERVFTLFKAFFLDILIQRRLFQQSFLRWIMHMLMFWGFVLLLFTHALGAFVIPSFFGEYLSTLNPYFFLRDLLGLAVLAGLAIAVFRRYILKVPRLKSNGMDLYAIAILAVIMSSGILLTGFKIASHSEFQRMVEDYAGMDDETEIEALESLWVERFGLVSPNVQGPFESDLLDEGMDSHEANCADCHADTKWAFTGYAVASAARPVALALDRAGIVQLLWYLHVLACFAGLAGLPFTKMFHIISTPVSLLVNSVVSENDTDPATVITRQTMELDACTHCGTCSRYCSAMMAYHSTGNEFVLPSEKMIFLKQLASGRDLAPEETAAIIQGIYLCTNCDRCTVVCPSGIRLKALWVNVREDLIQRQVPEPLILSPLSFTRGLNRDRLMTTDYSGPITSIQQAVSGEFDSWADSTRTLSLSTAHTGQGIVDRTFTYCFGCQNCTTVCPVVGNYEYPQKVLGLLPHQIMCSLGLGMDDMASGASMIWNCLTCYQCQEHCPEKVKVTELLFELKNKAANDFNKNRLSVNREPTIGNL